MKRMWALCWDHLILFTISIILLFPIFRQLITLMTLEKPIDGTLLTPTTTVVSLIAWLIVILIYEPFTTWKYGGTVGKFLCKIKVINDKGQKIDLAHSIARFLIKSLCLALPYANFIILIICYFQLRTGKKVIWDHWIGTSVVLKDSSISSTSSV